MKLQTRTMNDGRRQALALGLGALLPLAILVAGVLLLAGPVAAGSLPGAAPDALVPLSPANGAVLAIGSDSVEPGEAVTVPLTTSLGLELLGAATIEIEYDPDVLDAVGCTPDPGSLFFVALCNTALTTDTVGLTFADLGGVSGDVLLAEITFQAVGAVGASSPLTLTADPFSDTGGTPIAVTLHHGLIDIVPPPLAAPSNLAAAAASPDQIELTWEDNSSDETAFCVERSPNGITGWTEIVTVTADTTSTVDAGLACNTTYYYQVRAYRAGDGHYSGYSNVANATTDSAPLAPALTSPADGSSTLETTPTFEWSAAPGATSYRIQVDDDAGFGSPAIEATTTGLSYTHSFPLAPDIYYWRGGATNACGDSPWSAAWNLTIAAPPLNLNLLASPGAVPADGVATSTLTAEVRDSLSAPAPDGTVVVFSTTLGAFPGGLSITPEPSGTMTVEVESITAGMMGTWLPFIQLEASGGQVYCSNNAGDSVTYVFTGTAVSVIFQKQYNAGIAHVYLDGMLYRSIDTYWDDGTGLGKLFQQEELVAEHLPYAPHVVDVVVTGLQNPASSGAYLVLDAFRAYGHDRNGAMLTSGGSSAITLTSTITPGIAAVTACAGPACDTRMVTFRAPVQITYLPLIYKNYPPPVPVCDELILNGSFEGGTNHWLLGTTPRPARHTNERAHTGSRSVLLGLKAGEEDVRSYSSAQQMVSLPAGAGSATLTFWMYPISDLDAGDHQDLVLLDPSGHTIAVLMRINDNSATWIKKSFDLTAFTGQTIRVYLNAYNDGDGNGVTSFYLDDVSLQVCTPGPEPPPPEPSPPPFPPPIPAPDCYPTLVAKTAVGDTPHGVAINSTAQRLYVTNYGDSTLSILDSWTISPVDLVPVGAGPNAVAYNRANDQLYVTNRNSASVTVLGATDYDLIKTIPVGLLPNGVAVNAVTNRIYVANYGSDTVSIINGETDEEIKQVAVGDEPSMIAVNPVTNKAYVTLHGAGRVAVIDGAGTAKQVDIFSAGPYGIAVDRVRNLVYVATIDTFRIVVIDGGGDAFLGYVEIRRQSDGQPAPLRMIAVNPNIGTSGHVFVTTAAVDGGWNRFLLLPAGWPEHFARAHALPLKEAQQGIAFDATTNWVFATSRSDDLVSAFWDGEPVCPTNFSALEGYRLTVCVANPDGTCREIYYR